MDFFTYLILWAVFFALSELLRPKPKLTNARPAGLGDFQFPTATEGRPVPLIWGTCRIKGPNVVWFGDLRVKPLTKKIKTGLFSSEQQTIGYRYLVGLQFSLARGVVDMLTRVWINDKIVYNGSLGAEDSVLINDANLFGGDNQNGGVKGTLRFYTGVDTQNQNAYLTSALTALRYRASSITKTANGTGYTVGDIITFVGGTGATGDKQTKLRVATIGAGGSISTFTTRVFGKYTTVPTGTITVSGGTGTGATFTATWVSFSTIPAYRGTCHAVWENGWVGNSTQISPWGFELRRCPNGLALTSSKHLVNVNGNRADANPANVLYEVLTDPDWGLGFLSGDIDLTAFRAAADTLYTEGNGFSMVMDNQLEVSEFVKELERQIDGIVYMDRATGKWTLKLIRADYVLADLPLIDESNIIEIKNFTRGSWHGTNNNIRVSYIDRDREYKQTYAMSQDIANIGIQGNVLVSVDEKYPGIMNAALANQIVWRGLRSGSTPVAKAQFVVNRTLHYLNPGDVVRWTDARLEFTELPMRVIRVDLGKLDAGEITFDAVQDIFHYDLPSMSQGEDSLWIDPAATAATDILTADRKVLEAPYKFCVKADEAPGVLDRIFVGARYPGDRTTAFDIWTDDGSGYTLSGQVKGYLLVGKLSGTLSVGRPQGVDSVTVTCDPDTQAEMLDELRSSTALGIGRDLQNIIMIGDELIGFKTADASGADIVLHNVYRGLMDTIQEVHASTTKVWFIAVAGNLTDGGYVPLSTVDVKLLTTGLNGTLDLASATASTVVFTDRARKPYPPSTLALNDVGDWPAAATIDFQSGTTLDDMGLYLQFNRRDFRCSDEVQALLDESTLIGGVGAPFPDANQTEYQATLYNDPTGANTLVKASPWASPNTYLFTRTKILREVLADQGGNILTESFVYSDGDLDAVSSGFWTIYTDTLGTVLRTTGVTISVVSHVATWAVTSAATKLRAGFHNFSTIPQLGVVHEFECKVTFHEPSAASNTIWFGFSFVGGTGASKTVQCNWSAPFEDDVTLTGILTITGYNLSSSTVSQVFAFGTEYVFKARIEADGTVKMYIDNSLKLTRATCFNPVSTEITRFGFWARSSASGYVTMRDLVINDAVVTPTSADLPTNMKIILGTRHLYDGVGPISATKLLSQEFTIDTSELDGLHYFGVRELGRETTAYTALTTGTFTVNTGHNMTVDYRINGGAWTAVISGTMTGTFAVTTADIIELKHTVAGDNSSETTVELVNNLAVLVAFGVFTY